MENCCLVHTWHILCNNISSIIRGTYRHGKSLHSIHNSTILSDICGGKAEQSIYIYMGLVYLWRHFFRGQPPIINQEDVVNN